jgi:RNA polymerase sigma factor (sigma-70 family)
MVIVAHEMPPWGDVGSDETAFERFFAACAGPCRRFLGKCFAGSGDGTLGRDALDEIIDDELSMAFLIARNHWERYDPARASAQTWVNAIARNRVRRSLEYHVRLARRQAALEEADGAVTHDVADGVATREAVAQTLYHLAERQAQVLMMHHVEGWPVTAIARKLETTAGGVESLLWRGRQGFRQTWEAQGGTP